MLGKHEIFKSNYYLFLELLLLLFELLLLLLFVRIVLKYDCATKTFSLKFRNLLVKSSKLKVRIQLGSLKLCFHDFRFPLTLSCLGGVFGTTLEIFRP